MHAPEEFLKHAGECEIMAKFTRDLQSRATWMGMADRWRRRAVIAKRQSSLVRPRKQARSSVSASL